MTSSTTPQNDESEGAGGAPRRKRATPYEIIGGEEAVRAVVDRFYDLVEADPAYRRLRAMHAEDLAPMRESLAAFLGFWLGGPESWRPVNGGGCVMSLHGGFKIDESHAREWMDAMTRAIADNAVEPTLAKAMTDAMTRMCCGMVNC